MSDPAAISDCEKHYRELLGRCAEVQAQSFSWDTQGLQAGGLDFANDLEQWVKVLSDRPETELLSMASKEYLFALLSLTLGQYRQAFVGLRLFLEIAMASVHFSGNEVELRTWLRGDRDIYWSKIVDVDKGIFSAKFVLAFFPDLASEAPHYRSVAEKTYRECSEFVHGNPLTSERLPDTLEFSETVYEAWHAKAASASLAVTFALGMRYLRLIDADRKQELESVILDRIGYLPVVRRFFGGATEEV